MEGLNPLFIFLGFILNLPAGNTQGVEEGAGPGNTVIDGKRFTGLFRNGEERLKDGGLSKGLILLTCLAAYNTILPGASCTPGELEKRVDALGAERSKSGKFPERTEFENAFEAGCRNRDPMCPTSRTCPPCDFVGCDTAPSRRGKCHTDYDNALDENAKAADEKPKDPDEKSKDPDEKPKDPDEKPKDPDEKPKDPDENAKSVAAHIHGTKHKFWRSSIFLGLGLCSITTMSSVGALGASL